MAENSISSEEFDRKFDADEDVSEYIQTSVKGLFRLQNNRKLNS